MTFICICFIFYRFQILPLRNVKTTQILQGKNSWNHKLYHTYIKTHPIKFGDPFLANTVADLEAPPLFAENLPSNVSKTQDFRPKIHKNFAIAGVAPPF